MMHKQTIVAVLLAALAAGASAFRSQHHSVAFVVRGGSAGVDENGTEKLVTDDDNYDNQTPLCVGNICQMRGGSDGVAGTSIDPLEDGDEYEYDEEEEELVLGASALGEEEEDEEEEEEDDEEDIEDDYSMVEADDDDDEIEEEVEFVASDEVDEAFVGSIQEDEAFVDSIEEAEGEGFVDSIEVAEGEGFVDSIEVAEGFVESVEEAEEETFVDALEEEVEDIIEVSETEVVANDDDMSADEEGIEVDAAESEDIEVEIVEEYLADESVDKDEIKEVEEIIEVTVTEETQETWEENTDTVNPYEGDTVVHHATDDDSSAFVDREELADAYDVDETIVGATSFRAGHSDEEDRASIDDVPAMDEAAAGIQEFEQTEATNEPETVEEMDEASAKAAAAPPAPITKEVEKILVQECGFLRSELRGLKPQIANVMADKKLRRPLEGIPASWYEAREKGTLLATVGRVLTAVIPVAIGALSIYGGLDVRNLFSGIRNDDLMIGEAPKKKRADKTELTIPIKNNTTATVVEVAPEEVPEPPVAVAPKPTRRRGEAQDDGTQWLDRKIDAIGDRMNSFLSK